MARGGGVRIEERVELATPTERRRRCDLKMERANVIVLLARLTHCAVINLCVLVTVKMHVFAGVFVAVHMSVLMKLI